MKRISKFVFKWGAIVAACAVLGLLLAFTRTFLGEQRVPLSVDAAPCETGEFKTFFALSEGGYARYGLYVSSGKPEWVWMSLQQQNGAEWEAIHSWELTQGKDAEPTLMLKGDFVTKGAYRVHIERLGGDDFNSRVLTYPTRADENVK